MGVILFEMVTGRLPFTASHLTALYKTIVAGDYKMPPDVDPAAHVRPSFIPSCPSLETPRFPGVSSD
jgi:hypothetical protein